MRVCIVRHTLKRRKTMATRSAIIREREDGLFEGVYCHNDGYLEHNGKILAKHYQDADKIKDLISHGDMSVLAEEVTGTNQCFYYHRDRNEEWEHTKPKISDSLSVLLERIDQEYAYLYKDGVWKYSKHGDPWKKLRVTDETSARICRDFVVTLPISEMTQEDYNDAIRLLANLSEEDLGSNSHSYYVETGSTDISDEDIEILETKGTW
jgi:hypothetical protein